MSSRFVILNPCHKRWTELSGDGRKRFCPECQTFIHAVDQYSAEEIAELRRKSTGPLCGYLAGESVPPPRSRRAVLVGVFLTAISPLMAQAGRVRVKVIAPNGGAIPNAEVSVWGKDEKDLQRGRANGSGEVLFVGLPIGDSRITVSAYGFKTLMLVVATRNVEELKIDAKLEVGDEGNWDFVDDNPWAKPEPAPLPATLDPPKKKRKRWWPF